MAITAPTLGTIFSGIGAGAAAIGAGTSILQAQDASSARNKALNDQKYRINQAKMQAEQDQLNNQMRRRQRARSVARNQTSFVFGQEGTSGNILTGS